MDTFPRKRISALVGVPLLSGTDTIGTFGVARDASDERPFGASEIERLQRFAQLASIALDNARLLAGGARPVRRRTPRTPRRAPSSQP